MWMAEGRKIELWNHTSSIAATLINVNRDPKKPAVSAEKLHPFAKKLRDREPVVKADISVLKDIFVRDG